VGKQSLESIVQFENEASTIQGNPTLKEVRHWLAPGSISYEGDACHPHRRLTSIACSGVACIVWTLPSEVHVRRFGIRNEPSMQTIDEDRVIDSFTISYLLASPCQFRHCFKPACSCSDWGLIKQEVRVRNRFVPEAEQTTLYLGYRKRKGKDDSL